MPQNRKKSRWKEWEISCIKKAFEQKIQHKVIAEALERTPTFISKKINKLRLRVPTSTPGRQKGGVSFLSIDRKIQRDQKKMSQIFSLCAPPNRIQRKEKASNCSELVSKKWSKFCENERKIPPIPKKRKWISYFSSPKQLKTLEKSPYTLGACIEGDPVYVPISYVERWALSEGFYPLTEGFQSRGLSYWKNGQYYSHTQLLILLNRIRLQNKLNPVICEGEEGGLQEKSSHQKSKHNLANA